MAFILGIPEGWLTSITFEQYTYAQESLERAGTMYWEENILLLAHDHASENTLSLPLAVFVSPHKLEEPVSLVVSKGSALLGDKYALSVGMSSLGCSR